MNFFKKIDIKKHKYSFVTAIVVLVAVFLDILLKIITDGLEIDILGSFFGFKSFHNTGAAYGMFKDKTFILTILSGVMLVAIIVYDFLFKRKTMFYSISVGLIIGGAIGNLIDRIFLGYVRDFINFSFFNFVFNIADACLTVGIALFALFVLFLDKETKNKKLNKTNSDGENE